MTEPESLPSEKQVKIDFGETKLTREMLVPGTVIYSDQVKHRVAADFVVKAIGKALHGAGADDLDLAYQRIGGDFVHPQRILPSEGLSDAGEILRTTSDEVYDFKGNLVNPKATILNKDIVRRETGFYDDSDSFWNNAVAVDLSATGEPDGIQTEIGRTLIIHSTSEASSVLVYVLPSETDPKVKALMANRNLRSATNAHNLQARNMQNPLPGGLPDQNS